MFYRNHLLALRTVEIFCNLILRNHWTWTRKIHELPYWTRIDFVIYGVKLEKYSTYCIGFELIL